VDKSDLKLPEDIRWLIESLMAGHLVYSRTVRPMVRQASRSAVAVAYDDQDLQMMALVRAQKTDSEIALELSFAEDTIGRRLQRLFKCTGIHDRTLLAKWFSDYVLIDDAAL
jgi:DNA-binding NarL/FixJ family response regulator